MGIIGKKLRGIEGGQVGFMCPGCNEMHIVTVSAPPDQPRPCWGYNGNPDAPTFTPSVLVRSGHFANGGSPGNCYCDYSERFPDKEPMPWKCTCCHSFVTDGRIQFLGDCTHALVNQTVDLADIVADPDWDATL